MHRYTYIQSLRTCAHFDIHSITTSTVDFSKGALSNFIIRDHVSGSESGSLKFLCVASPSFKNFFLFSCSLDSSTKRNG